MITSTAAGSARRVSVLAIPLLGYFAGVEGAAPNIASTALVGASRSLHMTGSTQALAASMQTLAIAATVITTGLLADRLGRRRVLMAALVVSTIGTLVVAGAFATWMYMLGMIIAGVGLGAVYGSAFAYIKAVAPIERLAAAMGTFVAVTMAVTLVATFVGGSLTAVNWRVGFFVTPALCLIGLVLVPILLPKVARLTGDSFDLPGQLLLGLGLIGVLYAISQLAKSLTSPGTLVPLAVGVVLLAGFAVWETRYHDNFFPMELFRSPVFLAAICFGFIYNFGNAVAFLQLTNLWQYINGLKTTQVSLWQLPLLFAGIVAGLITGRVMARGMTNRVAGLVGGLMSVVGYVLLALMHSSKTLVGFLPGALLVGAGVVVAAVPFGNLVLREAPAKSLGPVSSSRTTFGQFFYTFGFAISAVLIDRMTYGGTTARLDAAGVPADQIGTALNSVTAYAANGTRATTSLGQQALSAASESYGGAFRSTMLISAVALLGATALATFLLRKGEGEPQPAADPEPATAA